MDRVLLSLTLLLSTVSCDLTRNFYTIDTGPDFDQDDDGVPTPLDCDYSDPDVQYDFYNGTINSKEGDFSDFCNTDCLRGVTGSVVLQNAATKEHIQNLHCLAHIGVGLHIRGTANLQTLEGLKNLTYIGGNLTVLKQAPKSLKGIEKLNYIGLDLHIAGSSIDGEIYLQGNPYLYDLSGLYNLNYVDQEVGVYHNASLCRSDFECLIDEIGYIAGNNITTPDDPTSYQGDDC